MRFHHPLVRRNDSLARRVESALGLILGVKSVSASATTGSVVVLFDPLHEPESTLLAVLEQVVSASQSEVDLPNGPSTVAWLASGSCLALATASTFVVPGLAPLTAAALVGFNLHTMGHGIVELCTLRWRIATLYTVSMVTTLISGQFLAAALMQASITCWHGWTSNRLRKVLIQLKSNLDFTSIPNRLQSSSNVLEDIHQSLPIGHILTIEQGAILPCDGIVVKGKGDFDERSIRGVERVVHREAGEHVFAGSVVIDGQLSIQVTAVGRATRHSQVHRTLLDSIRDLPGTGGPTERGKSNGSRFVPFTFAAGTAALAVGDITTLAAVLRPDFTTGPSISERFSILSQIGHLLSRGWLVKKTETLERLALTETIVILRTTTDRGRTEFAKTLRGFRKLKRHRATVHSRSVEIHELESDETACVEYVRQLQAPRCRLTVLSSGRVLKRLTGRELVRVSLTPEDSFDEPTVDVIALDATQQPADELLRVLHESQQPAEHAWAAVLACNALAISGAFVIGLTGLHVVALTNLGILAASVFYELPFRRAGRLLTSRVHKSQPNRWTKYAPVNTMSERPTERPSTKWTPYNPRQNTTPNNTNRASNEHPIAHSQ